ncbi:S9 family peptidase [Arenimonas composti]|uniref:Acyl-peptide hydrolase n=1 Tax=Arenimonas composti TR7-09 = DSM 18010 TaxID=1121013 RepID=A0A091BF41_9GAMM|nr:S9 family peptidase [Arenimonas composti]KFN50162.1 hypothetical protein P873_07955 [Arenimonas composti TR7-09 = DSM 18010]
MRPSRHLILALAALAAALSLAACERGSGPASGGTAAAAAEAVARPSRQYTIEEFVASTQMGGVSFNGDESKLLFAANRDGVWNVFTVPVEGGDWMPVTNSTTDNSWAVSFFPNDDRILIARDKGGDELDHLYVIAADGSETDLTPGTGPEHALKADFLGFSGDGDHFWVVSNERDPRFFDLYRYASDGYARELVFRNDQGWEPSEVSPDGRFAAFADPNTTNDGDLHVVELATGKATKVSEHTGDAIFAAQDFSPDGEWLYYTANDAGEFAALRRVSTRDWTHEDVRSADWDIVDAALSDSGRYLAVSTNVDGSTGVQLFDTTTNTEVALPELPGGEIRNLRIGRSDARLAFYLNGDRQPSDLYVLDLGGEPRALTRALNPAIDAADLVDSQVVRFPSFDGLQIPNILWKPHQASADNRAPALVWVHGGPGGQTTRAFAQVQQFLANHGYVVLGINNRGSSGYGKTFYAADDGRHGREPLWDVIEAKRWLAQQDYVDPDRIGVIGGSYGGYMVLAALAYHPGEFRAGVDIFGVANWVRTLESIPPYWESFREALYREIGNPETQRDFLLATSPLNHAGNIDVPLMVLQGANDPRVIQPESDDVVAAVRANGVPVEYVVFPDEGHGFTKKANQIAGYGAVLAFLDEHLKNAPVPAPAPRPARIPVGADGTENAEIPRSE